MSVYGKADDIDPGSSKTKHPPLPVGDYAKLEVIKCSDFRGQKGSKNEKKQYYKADLKVHVGPSEAKVGQIGTFFATVDGNDYESQNLDELAMVKQFVGFALGFKTDAEVKAKVTGGVIPGTVAGDGKALQGHFVSARVAQVVTGKGVIAKFDFYPCAEQAQTAPVATSATTPPAASLPPPVAAPAAVGPTVPAGWTVHPANPAFMYELANVNNIKPMGSAV